MHCKTFLCKRILRRIAHACRLIVADLLHRHTDILKYFVQRLAVMSECHRAVVREILLNQHMAVKSSHLRDGENTDRSKRSCRHRKHLPMCDISAELAVCGALQTEKRNVPRHDVPLKGSVCHLDRKASRHDLLIAHLTERKLSGSGISTVESHKGVL